MTHRNTETEQRDRTRTQAAKQLAQVRRSQRAAKYATPNARSAR